MFNFGAVFLIYIVLCSLFRSSIIIAGKPEIEMIIGMRINNLKVNRIEIRPKSEISHSFFTKKL